MPFNGYHLRAIIILADRLPSRNAHLPTRMTTRDRKHVCRNRQPLSWYEKCPCRNSRGYASLVGQTWSFHGFYWRFIFYIFLANFLFPLVAVRIFLLTISNYDAFKRYKTIRLIIGATLCNMRVVNCYKLWSKCRLKLSATIKNLSVYNEISTMHRNLRIYSKLPFHATCNSHFQYRHAQVYG